MQNNPTKDKSEFPESEISSTIYGFLNVGASAFIITTMISIFKLPIDNVLLHLTQNNNTRLNLQTMSSIGLMAGMSTYVRANMPRSCYSVVSKNQTQANKNKEFETGCVESLETVQESVNDFTQLKKQIKNLPPYMTIPLFAAGETFLTHTPEQLTTLKQLNVEYNSRKLYNYYAMTKAGLGLRFTSSLLNILGMTFIQESYAKMLFQQSPDSISANLISGALSGVTAAVFAHPLRQVSLNVAMSGKSDAQKTFLTYEKTSTICKKLYTELKQSSPKENFKDALPKLSLRSVQSALVFSVISVMSKVLGPRPAEDTIESIESFLKYKK